MKRLLILLLVAAPIVCASAEVVEKPIITYDKTDKTLAECRTHYREVLETTVLTKSNRVEMVKQKREWLKFREKDVDPLPELDAGIDFLVPDFLLIPDLSYLEAYAPSHSYYGKKIAALRRRCEAEGATPELIAKVNVIKERLKKHFPQIR